MRVVDKAVEKAMDSVYGCGAGVLRTFGLNAWSRWILNARTTALVRAQLELLETTLDKTRQKLKELTDEMHEEQVELDASLLAVRRMSNKRLEERRVRAERMGVPFTFKKSDLLMWMNDYAEIQKIEDLRVHKMRYRKLEKRVRKLHTAMLQIQQQQAAFEDVLGNSDLIHDVEFIADQLKESNSVNLNLLVTDLVNKAYKITDDMNEARDTAAELTDEMKIASDILPERQPMSKEEAMDIVDLIFQSTEAPRIAPAAAPLKIVATKEKMLDLA